MMRKSYLLLSSQDTPSSFFPHRCVALYFEAEDFNAETTFHPLLVFPLIKGCAW